MKYIELFWNRLYYCIFNCDKKRKLSEMNLEKLNVITLTESGGLTGEIVVVKKGHKHKRK